MALSHALEDISHALRILTAYAIVNVFGIIPEKSSRLSFLMLFLLPSTSLNNPPLNLNTSMIIACIITDINCIMQGIQDQWTKVINSSKKQVEKLEEVSSGLVEYCIALTNHKIKCTNYAEALSMRIKFHRSMGLKPMTKQVFQPP
jgi:hypothetical protein